LHQQVASGEKSQEAEARQELRRFPSAPRHPLPDLVAPDFALALRRKMRRQMRAAK
jgi:hypothetical protein